MNLATALKSHLKNLSTYLISTLLELYRFLGHGSPLPPCKIPVPRETIQLSFQQDQLPEGMPPEGFQNDGQDGQLPE